MSLRGSTSISLPLLGLARRVVRFAVIDLLGVAADKEARVEGRNGVDGADAEARETVLEEDGKGGRESSSLQSKP